MLSSIVLIFLMIGVIMTIDGIYNDEIKYLKNNPKVIYRNVQSGIVETEFLSSTTSPADFTTLEAALPKIIDDSTKAKFTRKNIQRNASLDLHKIVPYTMVDTDTTHSISKPLS